MTVLLQYAVLLGNRDRGLNSANSPSPTFRSFSPFLSFPFFYSVIQPLITTMVSTRASQLNPQWHPSELSTGILTGQPNPLLQPSKFTHTYPDTGLSSSRLASHLRRRVRPRLQVRRRWLERCRLRLVRQPSLLAHSPRRPSRCHAPPCRRRPQGVSA